MQKILNSFTETYEKKINDLQSENNNMNKKINDLQSENNNMNTKINDLQSIMNKRQSEMDAEKSIMNKKINDLQSENNNMNNNISKLSIEVEDLKNELNTIKIRDKIKNILKSFSFILTAAEEKELEQKIKKPIEIYPKAFEKHYAKYSEFKKFLFLKILLTKSCELLEEGNRSAHTLLSQYYIEKIENFVTKNKIANNFINAEKILFLSLCDLPEEYINYSIELVNDCLDENFSKIFVRSKDVFEEFILGENIE